MIHRHSGGVLTEKLLCVLSAPQFRTWISPHKHWDVIIHSWPYDNGGLARPPFRYSMDNQLHATYYHICNYAPIF